MNAAEITIIILNIVNILTSLISPIILGISNILKRIERSSCCGSSVDLHNAKSFIEQPKQEPQESQQSQKSLRKSVITQSPEEIIFLDRPEIRKLDTVLEPTSGNNSSRDSKKRDSRNGRKRRHKSVH